MFVSIRRDNCNYSEFVNVDKLISNKNSSYDKVFSVYKSIQNNINSYEPEKSDKLKEICGRLKDKAIHIVEKEFLAKTNRLKLKEWVLTLIKILSFDICHFDISDLNFRKVTISNKKTNRMQSINSISDTINKHLSQIEESQKEKQVHKLEQIEEIVKKRKTNIDEELTRLLKNERIKKSLESIVKHRGWIGPEEKVAIAHTIEIREVLKEEYYVINHGQNLDLMIINIFSRALKRHFDANKYDHLRILRHDIYLQQKHNVNWFKEQIVHHFRNDHHFRKELISGDIFLESVREGESALDFFLGRQNIAVKEKGSGFMTEILSDIVSHYFPNKDTRKKLSDKLLTISHNCSGRGNLYSIAIPKNKFFDICYLSIAYGIPVKDGKYKHKHLEGMQDGQCPGENKMPYERWKDWEEVAPQVRILTHKLTPENGVYIFRSSTATDEVLKKVEEDVELLIQRAQTQFRF